MPPAQRAPSSAARVVYAGIFASTIIINLGALVVSLSLRASVTAVSAPDLVVLLAGLGALLAGIRLRHRLGGRRSGQTREEWWGENAGRALMLWGLLELCALPGAVLMFATGHVTIFAGLTAMAVASLAMCAPGRLTGD